MNRQIAGQNPNLPPHRSSPQYSTERSESAKTGAVRSSGVETQAASPWLNRFALLTAAATLGLIILGGLVTSRGVGMAVPDWPNTYGYNMFLFPVSKWIGGILYEHSHRLMAALVGLLTTVLAVWLWVRDTRGRERWLGVGAIVFVLVLMGVRAMPVFLALAGAAPVVVALSLYRIRREPNTLRWWGVIAFAAVILQGVLGGLRVVWLKDEIGIFHALLAQLFFALTCAIVLFTSRWWQRARASGSQVMECANPVALWNSETVQAKRHSTGALQNAISPSNWLLRLALGAALLILGQLILGATMRHQHAGLAIPDFPLAYGKLWPAMDAASVAQFNRHRIETEALNPITAFQIALQMAHRIAAMLIVGAVGLFAWSTRRQLGKSNPLSRVALSWVGLILLQALLGAATVWSNKAADIATAHVLVGALSLAFGTILSIVSFQALGSPRAANEAGALTPGSLGSPAFATIGLK